MSRYLAALRAELSIPTSPLLRARTGTLNPRLTMYAAIQSSRSNILGRISAYSETVLASLRYIAIGSDNGAPLYPWIPMLRSWPSNGAKQRRSPKTSLRKTVAPLRRHPARSLLLC